MGRKSRRKKERKAPELRELHTLPRPDGSELTVKVYNLNVPDAEVALIEDISFEEALLRTFLLAPCPSISLYRDAKPACGNPECALVLVKHEVAGLPVPAVGIGAGVGVAYKEDFLTGKLAPSENPSAPYFREPCDACRLAFQERGRKALREAKATADGVSGPIDPAAS